MILGDGEENEFEYLDGGRLGNIKVPKSKPIMSHQEKRPCCPKCNFKGVAHDSKDLVYFGEEYCGKPNCPCHHSNCCEKCNESWGGGSTMLPKVRKCGNLDCPCHKSSEKENQSVIVEVNAPVTTGAPVRIPTTNTGEALENRHIKVSAGAKDFAERFEPVMKELAGEAPTDESWKKSFDVIFGKNIIIPRRTIEDEDVFLATKLKVFISELLQEEREKGRRKGDATGDLRCYMEGLENGKQLGKSEAFATVRKVIEGKKLLEVAVSPDRLLYKQRWNAALSDLLATLGE